MVNSPSSHLKVPEKDIFMLFPNKIYQCILLLFSGMAASVLPLFIICDDVPLYLSTLSLFIVTFAIPFIVNRIRKRDSNIDYSYNYLKTIKDNKIIHLSIILYLIISITVKNYLHITENENGDWEISLLIGAIVYGPIIEELIFRYTILSGLLERYSAKCSILISSVLFALMHYDVIETIYDNLYSIINAFVLSVFLGAIFTQSRNIVYVILIHSLINHLVLIS